MLEYVTHDEYLCLLWAAEVGAIKVSYMDAACLDNCLPIKH